MMSKKSVAEFIAIIKRFFFDHLLNMLLFLYYYLRNQIEQKIRKKFKGFMLLKMKNHCTN